MKTNINDMDLDIRLMSLKATDVVVIKLNEHATNEAGERILEIGRLAFPDNKVVVLNHDVEITTGDTS